MSSGYASHSLEQAASLGPGKWESGWKYRLYRVRQTKKVRMEASTVRQPCREQRTMMMTRRVPPFFPLRAHVLPSYRRRKALVRSQAELRSCPMSSGFSQGSLAPNCCQLFIRDHMSATISPSSTIPSLAEV